MECCERVEDEKKKGKGNVNFRLDFVTFDRNK